jgi:hypothetical protein
MKLGIDWLIGARADELNKLDIIALARQMERGYLAEIERLNTEIERLQKNQRTGRILHGDARAG